MQFAKTIKLERKRQYKRLRKLRKARDIASNVSTYKREPWKLSLLKKHFESAIDYQFVRGLAYQIQMRMPALLSVPKAPLPWEKQGKK